MNDISTYNILLVGLMELLSSLFLKKYQKLIDI